jgi:hypothetical protein
VRHALGQRLLAGKGEDGTSFSLPFPGRPGLSQSRSPQVFSCRRRIDSLFRLSRSFNPGEPTSFDDDSTRRSVNFLRHSTGRTVSDGAGILNCSIILEFFVHLSLVSCTYFHCAYRFLHPMTYIRVRLHGPCFKTGRQKHSNEHHNGTSVCKKQQVQLCQSSIGEWQ